VGTSSGWRSCEEVEDRLPDGRHAWLRWRSRDSFLSRCFEAPELKEGVGDHCHQRMSMYSRPGSTFEVVETESSLSCWCDCSQTHLALIV
jgi:hypothetical protein